jgi:formate/nitrite transporter FocA (FNT family)
LELVVDSMSAQALRCGASITQAGARARRSGRFWIGTLVGNLVGGWFFAWLIMLVLSGTARAASGWAGTTPRLG